MPAPIITPVRLRPSSSCGFQPESSTACLAAAMAKTDELVDLPLVLGQHDRASALKWPLALSPCGTSPAILVARSEVSKAWMARMPDSAAISLRQLVSTPSPNGVTMPMPVTTTRLIVRLAFPQEPASIRTWRCC